MAVPARSRVAAHDDSVALELLRSADHMLGRVAPWRRLRPARRAPAFSNLTERQPLHDYGMPYPAFARTRYDARMDDFVCPTLSDIRLAAARIAPYAVVTPVLRNDILDEAGGASVYFKCEHLQRGGAFKFRGACNAVWATGIPVSVDHPAANG